MDKNKEQEEMEKYRKANCKPVNNEDILKIAEETREDFYKGIFTVIADIHKRRKYDSI